MRRRTFLRNGLWLLGAPSILRAQSFSNAGFIGSVGTAQASAGAGVSYLLEENFEGTGAPSGWNSGGTVNWDYTTTVLQGSQSLLVDATSGSGWALTTTFTAQTTIEVYFLYRTSTPTADAGYTSDVFYLRDGSSIRMSLVLLSNATLWLTHGANSAASGTAFSANTTYHVWLRYVAGSGANGVAKVAASTTGTRPTADPIYAEVTTGTATTSVDNLMLVATNMPINKPLSIFDRLLVSTSAIGDNP